MLFLFLILTDLLVSDQVGFDLYVTVVPTLVLSYTGEADTGSLTGSEGCVEFCSESGEGSLDGTRP